jgi:hypothetical protein
LPPGFEGARNPNISSRHGTVKAPGFSRPERTGEDRMNRINRIKDKKIRRKRVDR